MTLQFRNNASTTLSGSINNTQTTITVANATAFPVLSAGDHFFASMYEVSHSVEINMEIVRVTATSGTNWTIVRAQDGTSARSRNGIDTCYVELRLTAASAALMLQKDENLADLASATTARTNLGLGSMATQAANAVAITGGTIAGVTLTGVDSSTTLQDNVDVTKQLRFELSGITTGTTRTLTVPDASGTILTTAAAAAAYQPLDTELTAIAAIATNGLFARTGAGTVAARSIGVPAAGLTITNADGAAGNPTLALANDLAAVEAINTTGFVRRTAADTWAASALVDGDLPSALTGKTYNALTLTAAATGFTVAGGTSSRTLTVSNTLTLAGTDGSTLNVGAGGTLGTGAFATIANYALLASANTFTAGQTVQGNITLDGASRRILGDFSNATLASRAMFQTTTANGATAVSAIPNGASADSYFIVFNNATPTNASFGWLSAGASNIDLYSGRAGSGTHLPLRVLTGDVVRATFGAAGALDLATGLREARVAMGASDIDLRAGNYFTRTISGATTLTVSNVPAAGTAASFILDLTNGGSAAITWWANVRWAGGTAPTLTSSGRDCIGFYTHDAGSNWTGLLLGKDVK
jgi:hypothetical protein